MHDAHRIVSKLMMILQLLTVENRAYANYYLVSLTKEMCKEKLKVQVEQIYQFFG